VTTVETTTKPIEVLLSRPHLEVTCRIVFPDGTAIAVGVVALSLRAAQREMTAWLIERGYEPAGQWSTKHEAERRAARTFRRPYPGSVAEPGPVADLGPARDPGPALPAPPPSAPAQPPPGPGLDPAPAPAKPAASRARRPAPANRPGRGRAGSSQAAETELRAWALADAQRDDVIRAAAAAGVSLARIQEITGIARTTIMRILGAPPRPAPRRPS
jgi:hypothetical protein